MLTYRIRKQTYRDGDRQRKTDRSKETKREKKSKIKTFLDMEKLVGPFHNSEKTEK